MAFTATSVRTLKPNYHLVVSLVTAVALVAAAAVVSSQAGGSGSSAKLQPSVDRSIPVFDRTPASMTFYLVSTQEAADRIHQAEAEMVFAAMEADQALVPTRYFHVMVAATPEEERRAIQLVGLASSELAEAGTLFNFVDARDQ